MGGGGGGKLQVHYGDLKNASAMFVQQEDEVMQMMNQINQHVSELQGGEFVGDAARAFYTEVENVLFPGMRKLTQYLHEASDLMLKLNTIFGDAEQQAGNLFKKTG